MGKESPLKLSQRGQDARQEVPMRTPKRLYAQERMIYQPELLTCPHCGDLLVMCNYLAWDKTVQMLDRVLSVASRPGRCPHATCAGSRLRLLSAEGQRIAPAWLHLWLRCARAHWLVAAGVPRHLPRDSRRTGLPGPHLGVPRGLSVSTGLSAAPGLPRAAAPRPPGPDCHSSRAA